MLRVSILDEAQRSLDSLPEKHRHQIAAKISRLAENPLMPGTKILEGFSPLRRAKAGKYRIIYFIEGDMLKVPLIEKRGDDKVYRRLKRLFG